MRYNNRIRISEVTPSASFGCDPTIYEVFKMRQDILIETVEALVKSETGIAPPFIVVLPLNFSPDEQVYNGHDSSESLKERLLRIENVKDVIRGTTMGVSLKHWKKDNAVPTS